MSLPRVISMPFNDTKTEQFLKKLGPGLITGAADDDPSGIATYTQAGAQFGFNMLWTVLFTYPLMVGIQIVSARIGRVSGSGLATNIRKHYSSWLLYTIVGLLLVTNTINIAADMAAMGEAVQLLIGGPAQLYALGFGLLSLGLQIFIPYKRYVRVLKWLTLALLTYIATIFVVRTPWLQVIKYTFFPQISWKSEYITTVVAVFGTTISPYLFFWQSSQEVEEQQINPKAKPIIEAPNQAKSNFKRIKIDTYTGMAFSNLVAFFIILTSAVTLHLQGITDIESSAQAAEALRPIAGEFGFCLFSAGIIGSGLLAVPVLAGSAAYAMADTFNWRGSLELEPKGARRFYGIIIISTVIGVALCFTSIDAIKALYWSAVLNGVISVPIMTLMMLMAVSPKVMGQFTIAKKLKILGWLATLMMAVAVATMIFTAVFQLSK
jgi:NRAMP (natural resistance-associated macrophage protein)-like metal ion transporter